MLKGITHGSGVKSRSWHNNRTCSSGVEVVMEVVMIYNRTNTATVNLINVHDD